MARPQSRSPAALARLRIKNRRKRYLDLHPDYFASPSLELAGLPCAQQCLLQVQEREAEGRKKGYSGTLEADLWRSEAKVQALANPSDASLMTYRRGEGGEIIAEEKDEIPQDKEEGLQRWRKQMELMFLRGEDPDFNYPNVDDSEEFDDRGIEDREAEEDWFDREEPQWTISDCESSTPAHALTGETGVQDF
ncbi:MAG: hypothetical protein Q9191_007993 [Dirinaria sp. TL-2023a]